MIREIAQIEVAEDATETFEAAFAEAAPLIEGAPGCHGARLFRGIEHPSRYRLVVGWDAVADHEAFRETEGFARWRALAGPHFAAAPAVEHVVEIARPPR